MHVLTFRGLAIPSTNISISSTHSDTLPHIEYSCSTVGWVFSLSVRRLLTASSVSLLEFSKAQSQQELRLMPRHQRSSLFGLTLQTELELIFFQKCPLVTGETAGELMLEPGWSQRPLLLHQRLFGKTVMWRLGISCLDSSILRRRRNPVLSTTDNVWSWRAAYWEELFFPPWVVSGHFLCFSSVCWSWLLLFPAANFSKLLELLELCCIGSLDVLLNCLLKELFFTPLWTI